MGGGSGRRSLVAIAGRVEKTFFRYNAIIGDRLHARITSSHATEVVLARNILNRMTDGI